MKKTFIIGKRQILLAFLIIILGVAVYLNWQLSGNLSGEEVSNISSESTLGEAVFVNGTNISSGSEKSYFEETKENREISRKKTLDELKNIIDNPKADEISVSEASNRSVKIATFSETENTIESLVKAKGFKQCVAVMSENNISVMVASEGLLSSDAIQIQDIAATATGYSYENIKIIEIKNS